MYRRVTFVIGFLAAWLCLCGTADAQQFAYVANRTSSSLSVVNTSTRAVAATIQLPLNSNPRAVAITPNGARVYVANFLTSSVSVINSSTNTIVASVSVGAGPSAIAMNAAGNRAYVACQTSNTVWVIDTSTNRAVATIGVGTGPTGVAITPDGTRAFVANQTANTVNVVSTSTNAVVATIPSTGWGPTGIAITPNGTRAYVANQTTNSVMVIDTTTNRVVTTIPSTAAGPTGLAVTPNGTRVYVANQTGNSVMAIDTGTNKVIGTIASTGTGPTSLAVTPDGSTVYVANGGGLLDNRMTVIATSSNTVVATISVGTSPYGVAITPVAIVPCAYSIAPTTNALPAGGGNGTVNVTTSAGCQWTSKSNTNWLTVTSGATGSGSGTTRYSVAANVGGARTGTLTIAGRTFTVTQAAAPCTYSITPTTGAFSAGAGTGTVAVSTSAGCSWTAVSNTSWLTLTSGMAGSGSGTTRYSVGANAGGARTGTLTIAGRTFTVTQAALQLFSISGNAETSGVTVTAGGSSVLSDPNGDYVLGNLPSGTYSVTASKAGCTLSLPVSVTIGPNATGVNFTLSCGAPLWQISTIAGLPAGTYINGAWARNRNDVFLWGTRDGAQGALPEAYLERWDGYNWGQVFFLANASAVGIHGTGASDLWLSAYYAPSGPAVVYQSVDDGMSWKQLTLPSQIGNSWVAAVTGTPNNIQASAGEDRIIRWDGTAWAVLSAGGITNNNSPGPMTMLSPTEGFYTTCWGWGNYNGASWTFHPGFDFCDVNSIWGMRDPATNQLLLLTGGNQNFSNGVRVWQFNGTDFGSKCGTVLTDPSDGGFICGGIFAGNGSYGYATGIWGSAPNDVYVTGKLGYPTGAGKIYHFDGVSWQDITGPLNTLSGGTLPVTTTIFGTAADDIWIPLADGRVLRYTR